MTDFSNSVIFGPAYLDMVIKVPGPIFSFLPTPFDQSLPVKSIILDESLTVLLKSDICDDLRILLPANSLRVGGEYHLREAILSRRHGIECQPVVNTIQADACYQQLGGMGAGFAKAFGGLLRMPLGDDAPGQMLCKMLDDNKINAKPTILPGHASDSTLMIQSATGDKLAAGYRDALINWQASEDDYSIAENADYIIFCGAPNQFMTTILSHNIPAKIMCAPAMRNIDDENYQLADIAGKISYLAMNALEWANLRRRDEIISNIPLISITDGARGCDIYLHGKSYFFPALPHPGPVDTNRAGETYASSLWKAIMHLCPDFPCRKISPETLTHIAGIAGKQAHRQLDLIDFAFPPDDWM